MSQSTKPEQPSSGAPAESDVSRELDESETPMLAVWIALSAIVVGGLYGLYLGTHTGATNKTDPQKESQLLLDVPLNPSQVSARRSA
jgi:hypothetical protein